MGFGFGKFFSQDLSIICQLRFMFSPIYGAPKEIIPHFPVAHYEM